MPVITLDAAKAHLGYEPDDTSDDAVIADLILAAEGVVEDEMGRPMVGPLGWASVELIPANVIHAVKLALGELHLNREASAIDLSNISRLVGRYSRVSIA